MNANLDLTPPEEQYKRKPRPMTEWDKIESERKKGKKNEYNCKGIRNAPRAYPRR